LRSSYCDPITRRKCTSTAPEPASGDRFSFLPDADYLEMRMMPKGSGSENMTWLKMLLPADGLKGIKKFVWMYSDAGGQGCPPRSLESGLAALPSFV